jgi:GDPmannose 4,6-dehydratase
MAKALVFGITGQDGAYLAQYLLDRGYEVHGTTRDVNLHPSSALCKLGFADVVRLHKLLPKEYPAVLHLIEEVQPDEIYNLSGQSSVGKSFESPLETIESHSLVTLNILESLRTTRMAAKFCNASSGECFGETELTGANETTPFNPRSPYAAAKAAAFWYVSTYRSAYGIFACSSILFNHESPFRPEQFVTRKIIRGACRIAAGERELLTLGNLNIYRDWGWAPEYVEGMHLMLKQSTAEDFVLATGEAISLVDFVRKAFAYVGLDYQEYVRVDESLKRPSDITYNMGNPSKARIKLGWQAQVRIDQVIQRIIDYELKTKNND